MALIHEGLNAEVEQLKIFAKKCRIGILGKEIRTFDKYVEWEFGDFEELRKKKKKKKEKKVVYKEQPLLKRGMMLLE